MINGATLVLASRYLKRHQTFTFEYPTPAHEKISSIVQYINRHYAEDITLAAVSGRFYLSPYHLSRTFKKVTGFTFVEYLNNVRIREAQRLLRETRLNVSKISEQVGFGSIAHFGRVFKAVAGQSPLLYRKLNRF